MQERWLDRSRRAIPGWGWPLLAAALLFLHSLAPALLFNEEARLLTPVLGIFLLYCVLHTMLVWACVHWLTPLLERRYPDALAPRMVFGLLILLGGVILLTIAVYKPLFSAIMHREVRLGGMMQVAIRAAMVSLFAYGWLIISAHGRTQAARALALRLETDALATDLDRTELAMLEAQIEPHFLFNTLAHVKRLYRVDSPQAGQILGTLIGYLERALPALRETGWTVHDELELISLYLTLLEQRFGGRLRYVIDASPDAAAVRIPALTMTTLVENAVRHGLGPKAGGGTVRIGAALNGAVLVIDVCDDGVGLRLSSGAGLGLATVRARLRGRFGAAATLLVAPGEGGGVHASIRITLWGADGQ